MNNNQITWLVILYVQNGFEPAIFSILGKVRNVEISRVTQQLLRSISYDFLAVFAPAHSKINQIALFSDEIIQEVSD